jgi:hypothetical protein
LPLTEEELAVDVGNLHTRTAEHGFHVRRGIILAVSIVTAPWKDPIESSLDISLKRRIGILLNDYTGGGVRHVNRGYTASPCLAATPRNLRTYVDPVVSLGALHR